MYYVSFITEDELKTPSHFLHHSVFNLQLNLLLCQVFINCSCCFTSFAHWYLSLTRQNLSFAKRNSPAMVEFLFSVCNLLCYFAKYSLIAAAAFLPSPIAKITVAAPRTMSPPAHTFACEVACFSSTVM